MPITVFEKLIFGLPCFILFLQNRLTFSLFAAGLLELGFGILFILAFLKTKDENYSGK